MITYEYKCRDCETIFEERHGAYEEVDIKCKECGSEDTFKYLGNSTGVFQLRGDGWTRKDSANESAGIPKEVARTAERLGKL